MDCLEMRSNDMSQITFEAIVNKQGIVQAHYHDGFYEGMIRFEMADPISVRTDLVAEALAALCGQYYESIDMKLHVSDRTKKMIAKRTGATVICRKGTRFWNFNKMINKEVKTLNFSGDIPNLSAMALTPDDTNKVSLDFGPETVHQYTMYDKVESKIIKTNVMQTHFPKISSDYYAIGAILYKDYFNTTYMITGLQLNPKTMNMTKIEAEQAIAGMINLPHTLGLTAVGHTHIACHSHPELVEDAIQSVKVSESFLNVQQRILVEMENDMYRLGLPLKNRTIHPTGIQWGVNERLDFYALYILKKGGRALAEYLVKDIPSSAEAIIQSYTLSFYEKYYPGVLHYLPKSIQSYVLSQLKRYEIPLYHDEDWQEFKKIQKWLRHNRT